MYNLLLGATNPIRDLISSLRYSPERRIEERNNGRATGRIAEQKAEGRKRQEASESIWDFSSWMFLIGELTAAALAMGLQ